MSLNRYLWDYTLLNGEKRMTCPFFSPNIATGPRVERLLGKYQNSAPKDGAVNKVTQTICLFLCSAFYRIFISFKERHSLCLYNSRDGNFCSPKKGLFDDYKKVTEKNSQIFEKYLYYPLKIKKSELKCNSLNTVEIELFC